MALRIRADGHTAVCAAESEALPGDVYLDECQHAALFRLLREQDAEMFGSRDAAVARAERAEARHIERCPFLAATERMMAERDAALARVRELEHHIVIRPWAEEGLAQARVAALEGALRSVLALVNPPMQETNVWNNARDLLEANELRSEVAMGRAEYAKLGAEYDAALARVRELERGFPCQGESSTHHKTLLERSNYAWEKFEVAEDRVAKLEETLRECQAPLEQIACSLLDYSALEIGKGTELGKAIAAAVAHARAVLEETK